MKTQSKGLAVVTGASSGIGAVYADRLARRAALGRPSRYLPQGVSQVEVRLRIIRPDRSGDLSVLPRSLKLEQDLAAAIRFQRLPECFLELIERVHMLHCGGERSISYEVSELLVYLFDLCARRIAYPIDEPESVEAKTAVDELLGRHSWELPALHAVHDNRAARFKRFGQLSYGSSTHGIEDEAKFLPVESLLNILV